MTEELFPIVAPDGCVIGSASRKECHSGSKLLHPVVHLHVFDNDGRLLLQKRSADKDIQPNRWDTSVGGHVDYGESISDALRREAGEELSLFNFTENKLTPYLFESQIERELINPFTTIVDAHYPFEFQQSEISEIAFWTREQILDNFGKGIFTPNFEQEYKRFFID